VAEACVPSFILIHPTNGHNTSALQTGRQDKTDTQRCDSIARTVLQTVAQNVLAWVTNGSGSDLKFFKIILFQHGTTSEMKYKCSAVAEMGDRLATIEWAEKEGKE